MFNKRPGDTRWLLCLSGLFFLFLFSCSTKKHADLIIHNAVIYTVDSAFSTAQSFAVKDGKFIAIGTNEEIAKEFDAKENIDAKGNAVYPGFIDSHCHFYEYGRGLTQVNLVGTKSFDEVLQRISEYAKKNRSFWIIGRGWDQNDWTIKEFPDKSQLDSLFPNIPVFIERIDGHAALVNSEALKRAGISIETPVSGGVIEVKNKKLTGIIIDNAITLLKKAIPQPSKEEIKNALLAAQNNCFAVGLTTVDDAGLTKDIIDAMDEFQKSRELKMRIYAMLSDNKENADHYLKNGPYKTESLNVSSFKFYADGALGSRGACLLQPYTDKPAQQGFLLSSKSHFDSAAIQMADKNFQMCTHCIGDSAVRLLLQICTEALTSKKNARWRIEHFQVTTPEDLSLLNDLAKRQDLIPSVQPTHATSDMYWAKDRLGPERIKYAYAYNDLLKASGMIALGTDFPVEDINPMYTFYAAVARKDLKGFPEGGFQPENALSRENTLRGMTSWGAYANAEESVKGSIEKGKYADFVILNKDIMKCEIDSVPKVKVIYTFVGGENVYKY